MKFTSNEDIEVKSYDLELIQAYHEIGKLESPSVLIYRPKPKVESKQFIIF